MNVVYDLINVKKFSLYTKEEKLKLKEQGRPLPDISIEKCGSSRGKSYKRLFTRDIYGRNEWICGCNRNNSLYCFPCLLFGGDNTWTTVGVTDLVHLSEKIKRHETSKNHLNNVMNLGLLCSVVNIHEKLDGAYWTKIRLFNESVRKNRYVLSKIIDCIKFCGLLELALGQDENSTSGIFPSLINFTAELDKTVAEHLRDSSVFKGISKEVQNDILDCMLEVCQEKILEEIQSAPYISVIADETNVWDKSQMVVIFRYVRNGDLVERFWTYLEPQSLTAQSLTADILAVLDPILENSREKLIAQSYDGAAVMSGRNNGVQARIKEKYNFAHFVHNYAHQLNSIMSKAASQNSQVRLFFGNLQEIPSFFKNSPQRVAVLSEIVGNNAPTHWNFDTKTVFEHRESMFQCMEEIENSFNNQAVCSAASSIRRMLQDPKFIFWLTFFHRIMPHVDILFNELEKSRIEPVEVDEKIRVFEKSILIIRDSIEAVINEAETIICEATPSKRPRNDESLFLHYDSHFDHRIAALEICDVIINCAVDRYHYKNHLLAASLLFSHQFSKYVNCFPDEKLNATCDSYPNLDRERLKTELSVIYSRKDCSCLKGAIPFLKLLIENNLTSSLQETKKLLEVLITIPMSTEEEERSFSTLNRVKTFLQNSVIVEERLVALSMISMEKKMIAETVNFNDKVIDKFAVKKNRKINLIFKK